jgi:hypothetical protein
MEAAVVKKIYILLDIVHGLEYRNWVKGKGDWFGANGGPIKI